MRGCRLAGDKEGKYSKFKEKENDSIENKSCFDHLHSSVILYCRDNKAMYPACLEVQREDGRIQVNKNAS